MREKETITYKVVHIPGVPVRLPADFSKETLQARMDWKEVFEVMKGKDLHPRLIHPAKLSFRIEGQIKCFPDKVKLKEFIITKPLYEMLKGLMKIKTRNSKMTTNSQLSTTEPKNNKNKNKLSKKLEQKQNHRNGDHMEGYQRGGGGEEWEKRYRE